MTTQKKIILYNILSYSYPLIFRSTCTILVSQYGEDLSAPVPPPHLASLKTAAAEPGVKVGI